MLRSLLPKNANRNNKNSSLNKIKSRSSLSTRSLSLSEQSDSIESNEIIIIQSVMDKAREDDNDSFLPPAINPNYIDESNISNLPEFRNDKFKENMLDKFFSEPSAPSEDELIENSSSNDQRTQKNTKLSAPVEEEIEEVLYSATMSCNQSLRKERNCDTDNSMPTNSRKSLTSEKEENELNPFNHTSSEKEENNLNPFNDAVSEKDEIRFNPFSDNLSLGEIAGATETIKNQHSNKEEKLEPTDDEWRSIESKISQEKGFISECESLIKDSLNDEGKENLEESSSARFEFTSNNIPKEIYYENPFLFEQSFESLVNDTKPSQKPSSLRLTAKKFSKRSSGFCIATKETALPFLTSIAKISYKGSKNVIKSFKKR